MPTTTARLVKTPKFYWTDPGLARLLSERPALTDGAIFETFVLDELLRWSSWQRNPLGAHVVRQAKLLGRVAVRRCPRLIGRAASGSHSLWAFDAWQFGVA